MSGGTPNSYLRNAVMTASPEQLHLMLYDGAIRFSLQARDAIEARDYETSYNKLSRAQAIILEMQNGLRPEVNRELCDRMGAIYSFIYRKLVDASVHHSVSDLDDALKILRYQRETWVMLIDKVNQARVEQGAAGPAQAPAANAGAARSAEAAAASSQPVGGPASVGSTFSIEG
ncbi:MAG: flagellar export chaperone FliS [Phycisphaerae bacterium]|nr:flagellar export chaperone FliS [Phycisphaerae bacterium]